MPGALPGDTTQCGSAHRFNLRACVSRGVGGVRYSEVVMVAAGEGCGVSLVVVIASSDQSRRVN